MRIDCHVHVSAETPPLGVMSPRLLRSFPFRFMQWRLGLSDPADRDRRIEQTLVNVVANTPELDAVVVLAFDAVHSSAGEIDWPRTDLYVANDYVADLAQRHPRLLFGASVHPYRKDAAAEVERCAQRGAALLKWLPIVQDFDPADPRCHAVYEALAHHNLPLLCHTGGEQTLPNWNKSVADPALLEPALKRGVKVIMAHCGTRDLPGKTDYLPTFLRLAKDYEHCYGDTAALCLPTRNYAFITLLDDPAIRAKLLHGSDWPVIPLPPLRALGARASLATLRERNWLRRDVLIKQRLGFDDAYFRRAAQVLRLPRQLAAV